MVPKPIIIFDLDGTLVDTAPDLLGALNVILVREGRRAVTITELRHLVGHGARAMFEHALLATGEAVPADRLAFLIDGFLDHYRANIARESRPFPGVPETLTRLAGQGAAMGVCTNKPHDMSELLLAELDLARFFPAVHGAGRTPYNKPDPRHLADVIAALGGAKERAVMVGDSATDVKVARAAGVPVIVMSYGYTPMPARELGADAVSDDFAEVPDLVRRLLASRF